MHLFHWWTKIYIVTCLVLGLIFQYKLLDR